MTITIEGPESFRSRVSELLFGKQPNAGGILANPIGRVILNNIEKSRQQLTITRWTGQGCNAGTTTDGKEDDAHPQGEYYYLGREDDPRTATTNERFDQSKSKGTGKGVNTVLTFSPGSSACAGGLASEPDVVLLHELVHALRKMQGLENSDPLDASFWISQYDDTEEWLAILVENVYRSGKGQTQFRGAHDPTTKLQPPEDTSDGFMDNPGNRSLMQKYYRQWRPVFGDLSGAPAKFNPFRAYTLNPVEYAKPPTHDQRKLAHPDPKHKDDEDFYSDLGG